MDADATQAGMGVSDFIVQALATLLGALAAFGLEALRRRREEKQARMQRFKASIFVLILQRTFLRGLYTTQMEPQRDLPIRAYSLHPILAVPPRDRFDVSELAFLLSTKEAQLLNMLATAESQYLNIVALVEQRNALHTAFQSRMEAVRAQTGQSEGTIDDIRAMAGPVLSKQLEMLTDALYDNTTHAIGFNRDCCVEAVACFKRLYPGEQMFGIEDIPIVSERREANDERVPQPPAPPRWGSDALTGFIDLARSNQYASFVRVPQYPRISEVDDAFVLISANLTDPPSMFASFFLMRAHAAFRAAAGLALATQPPEAFMVMRGCLESALYGLYVARHPAKAEIWLSREDSDAAKREVKKEFTIGNMWKCLKDIDEKLQGEALVLYERTISMGGHPNSAAIATALRTEKTESGLRFKLNYLNVDPEMLTGTAKSVAQVGIVSLEILRYAFEEKYDALELTSRLKRLREGL